MEGPNEAANEIPQDHMQYIAGNDDKAIDYMTSSERSLTDDKGMKVKEGIEEEVHDLEADEKASSSEADSVEKIEVTAVEAFKSPVDGDQSPCEGKAIEHKNI